jgi:hypothetical protein
MRLGVALLTSALILLASWLYLRGAERSRVVEPPSESAALAPPLRIEIELTFDAGPDPFAEDLEDSPSLMVRTEGRTVLRRQGPISAGQPITIEDLTNFRAGRRELLIEATPQDTTATIPRAIRVSIYRRGQDRPLTSEVLWSEPGAAKVDGVVAVTLPEGSSIIEPGHEDLP